jgi:hypothetical protein
LEKDRSPQELSHFGDRQQYEKHRPLLNAKRLLVTVREAQFSLCLLEADLYSRPAAGRPSQAPERRPLGSEDRIRGELFGVLDRAAHQKLS